MRQAVIYLRVSTIEQTTANQERELREIASRMGCEIVKVYRDHGISGAKGATSDRRSTSCAVMPRDGNSTWSWRGRWTGRAIRRQSIDGAAHQPPFRRRKRRRG